MTDHAPRSAAPKSGLRVAFALAFLCCGGATGWVVARALEGAPSREAVTGAGVRVDAERAPSEPNRSRAGEPRAGDERGSNASSAEAAAELGTRAAANLDAEPRESRGDSADRAIPVDNDAASASQLPELRPCPLPGGAFWAASPRHRESTEQPNAETGAASAGPPSLAPLVDAVRGSVVSVATMRVATVPTGTGPAATTPTGGRATDRTWPVDRPLGGTTASRASQGTGLIIHRQGLVLTALHVVAGGLPVQVEIPRFGGYPADLVGYDESTDLALLQLRGLDETAKANLVVPGLGDSRGLRQGDWIFSLGEPLAFRQTLTVGVVGYVGRHLRPDGRGVSNDYLQFSAASLPGSSGSPVFALDGSVVGLVTRATDGGPSFAITSRAIGHVLRAMQRGDGRVRRAQIGLGLARATLPEEARLGLEGSCAFLVTGVEEGQPAARAGLRAGDVLVACDGMPIPSMDSLHERITWARPGDVVRFEVARLGWARRAVTLRIAEAGSPEPSDDLFAADRSGPERAPRRVTDTVPTVEPDDAAPPTTETASAARAGDRAARTRRRPSTSERSGSRPVAPSGELPSWPLSLWRSSPSTDEAMPAAAREEATPHGRASRGAEETAPAPPAAAASPLHSVEPGREGGGSLIRSGDDSEYESY